MSDTGGPTAARDSGASPDVPPPLRGSTAPNAGRLFPRWSLVGPALLGAVYGLGARLLFGMFQSAQTPSIFDDLGWPMMTVVSVGFVLVLPLVIGCIVAWRIPLPRFGIAIGLSLLSVLLMLVGASVSLLEGTICIAMMAPIAMIAAAFGAVATTAFRRARGHDGANVGTRYGILLLPFAFSAVEARIGPAREERTVATSIAIRAPADTVWANVVRVPEIREEERETTLFHRIGFPRPLAATIDGTGVGAVRRATFERGAVFLETVTTWRDREELAFSIDVRDMPPTAFDEHVVPGGAFFATLEGRYRLEPLEDGTILLHLTSRSRLTTTLNWYAAPWIDGAMRSIQDDILRILRARCERGELPR